VTSRQTLQGHKLVSPARLRELGDGTHRIHTTSTGHNVYAVKSGGKVRGLRVTDRRGRPVLVTKRIVRKQVRVSYEDPEGESEIAALSPAEPAFGSPRFVVFICFGFNCDGHVFWICFQMSGLFGGGGDPGQIDPNGTDPNGTDPNGTDPNGTNPPDNPGLGDPNIPDSDNSY
jgi:hypothetical protein